MDLSYISDFIVKKNQNLALTIMTAAISTASILPASAAIITTGLTLNFDAGLDINDNNIWENTQTLQTHNWQLGDGVTRNSSPITGFSGITGSYVFPASGSDSSNNKATARSYESIPENPTDNSTSFEIWFRPESLDNGDQVLWETGASVYGSSLTIIDGNKLRFTTKNQSENLVIETLIPQTNEFIQALVTYDINNPDSTDTLSLYINGELVDTETSNGLNNWGGIDGSGLGGFNGVATGGNGAVGDLNFGNFEGEIAIFRFYELALSESQVEQNFNEIVTSTDINEPSSILGLLGLFCIKGGSIFRLCAKKFGITK